MISFWYVEFSASKYGIPFLWVNFGTFWLKLAQDEQKLKWTKKLECTKLLEVFINEVEHFLSICSTIRSNFVTESAESALPESNFYLLSIVYLVD